MTSISLTFEHLKALHYGAELLAVGIFFFFLILRTLFTKIVISFAQKITDRTVNTIDDELLKAIKSPIQFLFVIIGLSLAFRYLELSPDWLMLSNKFIKSLYVYTLFWALFCCVSPLSRFFFTMGDRIGRSINSDIQHFFVRTIEVIVFIIGAVTIFEQIGINISAFLGGVGLAGMAIALAAKDSVANLFGTMMIFADRTFQKGDWIQSPQVEGTVEVIGLRASKIRTFAKALVNVPNGQLANSPIINWSRMTNRRIKMTISLEYRSTAAQLEQIINRLREFVANHPDVEPKGPVAQMIHLVGFGPSSIDIDLYYFTKTTDWEEWRKIRSDHILAFKKIVEEEGCSFAFPSTSLYIEKMPDGQSEMMSERAD
jgi:MscS family membrane protein